MNTMICALKSELGAARKRAEEEKRILQLGEVLKRIKTMNQRLRSLASDRLYLLRKPRCPKFLRSLFFMGAGLLLGGCWLVPALVMRRFSLALRTLS